MFESLRRLLEQVLALLQVRVELLTAELSAEVRRAAVIVVWAFVALLFGALGMLMVTVTILVAFWEQHRLLAAGLVTLLFFGVAALAAWQVLRRVRKPLLAASLEELRRDRAAIAAAGRPRDIVRADRGAEGDGR